jgi:hypothetical protein
MVVTGGWLGGPGGGGGGARTGNESRENEVRGAGCGVDK